MPMRVVLVAPLAAFALAGCGREPPAPPAAVEPLAVFVAPAAVEIPAGAAVQLVAQANDAQGRAIGGASLDFDSADPAIADVTPHGLVSATGPAGTTEIRVASGNRETLVPVTVRAGEPRSVAFVAAVPAESAVGGELPVTVRVVDAFGNAIAGARVAFVVTAGDGAVEPAEAATDPGGVAAATWRLGVGGEQAIEARGAGLAAAVARTLVPIPPQAEPPAD